MRRPPRIIATMFQDQNSADESDRYAVRNAAGREEMMLDRRTSRRKPSHLLRILGLLIAVGTLATAGFLASMTVRIKAQSTRDEIRPADVIMVLGAAEYRGRPSPVLKARLDHALQLYRKGV